MSKTDLFFLDCVVGTELWADGKIIVRADFFWKQFTFDFQPKKFVELFFILDSKSRVGSNLLLDSSRWEDRRTRVTPTFPKVDGLLWARQPTPPNRHVGAGPLRWELQGWDQKRRTSAADALLVTTAAGTFNQSARSPITTLPLSDILNVTFYDLMVNMRELDQSPF